MNVRKEASWEAAVKRCKVILQEFIPEHDRIELKIHFYVFTPRSDDPLIVKTPEEALKEARSQDRVEKGLDLLEREWAKANVIR